MEHCRGVPGQGRGWWGKFHSRVSKMSKFLTWSKHWNQLWSLPRFSGIFIFIFYTATFCNFVLPSIKCILAEMTDFRNDSISRSFHGELVSLMKAMIKDSWVKGSHLLKKTSVLWKFFTNGGGFARFHTLIQKFKGSKWHILGQNRMLWCVW